MPQHVFNYLFRVVLVHVVDDRSAICEYAIPELFVALNCTIAEISSLGPVCT